jgi:hypothetical protein
MVKDDKPIINPTAILILMLAKSASIDLVDSSRFFAWEKLPFASID